VVNTGERDAFVPISPCRLFDLRPAPDTVGSRATPLSPGETYTQPVRGANGLCNIPADATAVAMNVTAVGGTAGSFLTIWPSDVSDRPLASNLNWVPGSPPTPNKVDVKLSADGSINLFNLAGSVSVLADVVGYYADHNHDDRYYTKAQIDGLPSSSVIAGGVVGSAGTVNTSFPRFGTTWTVTHTPGSGSYTIKFPGLFPGCTGILVPLMMVSGLEASGGSQSQISIASTFCASGDTSVFIETFSTTGVLTDRGFQFMAYLPGDHQLHTTSAPRDATECTVEGTGTLTCV